MQNETIGPVASNFTLGFCVDLCLVYGQRLPGFNYPVSLTSWKNADTAVIL